MATFTDNYNLKKPNQDEYYNVDDFNGNADILDGALYGKVDKVNGMGLSANDYSDADKTKLETVENGAQVNSVTSVAGKTGAINLNKSDVGLGNVDNTADSDKPMSAPVATLLNNPLVKDAAFAYSTSDAAYKVTLTFYTPSDGTQTTELKVLPLATENASGIMPKEMYAQIVANAADISLLKGHAVRYPAHLGTQTPTDAQLTAIVTAAGGSLEDGVTVIDLDYSKEYTYFAVDSDWHDMGQTTVTVGTLTSLGVVMGSEANGKIYIEADGTMSLIGYDAIITALAGKAPTSHASTGTTYGRSTASSYGHAKASGTTPLVAGTAAVGTDDGTYARGNHVHPAQSSVSGNAGSATKLATPRTIDGVSFDGSADITHYGTCSTAAATAAKTVSLPDFEWMIGAKVAVKFTVTNTAASSPTLNVNGTGAKPIRWRGSAIAAGTLEAGRVYEFVYDSSGYELVGDAYSAATTSDPGIVTLSDTYNSVLSGVAGVAASQKAVADVYSFIRNSLFLDTDRFVYYSIPGGIGYSDNLVVYDKLSDLCLINYRGANINNGEVIFTLPEQFRPTQVRTLCASGSALMEDQAWRPIVLSVYPAGGVVINYPVSGMASDVFIQCTYFKSLIATQ
jgi:hypothetical protein